MKISEMKTKVGKTKRLSLSGRDIKMSPKPAERRLFFVGDSIRIELFQKSGPTNLQAFLRTTLGQDDALRQKAMVRMTGKKLLRGTGWRNIPMKTVDGRHWWIDCTFTEPGFFFAKPYLSDQNAHTYWPDGDNIGMSVHPASLRSGNTIYCAFPRLFGKTRSFEKNENSLIEGQLNAFDAHGYTVIPPSGTLRDVTAQLPHIIDELGCRILHLMPVNATPTTYARMGQYGSPYAALDLTSIDPHLVEFDKKNTGVDQFCELTRETHHRGAYVMLDLVINHTGWGSWLQDNHPDWFLKKENGEFKSPGAWGVTWGDLVELDQSFAGLWEHIAEAFLTWCRRGVDGFRCDAGYMVPVKTWKAITARVREEFPETVFLLEGLGGPWDATEKLLTRGRMQWAYSELFQNYDGKSVADYNDHSILQNSRIGTLVHYSETHDNDRLAQKGKIWSLLRNRLCALASQRGAFGFTCGVEWLAAEKINVHKCSGLNWGAGQNIVKELSTLNFLLQNHPCFHDNAVCRRVSPKGSDVYVLERKHEDCLPNCLWVLVIANTNIEEEKSVFLDKEIVEKLGNAPVDLLGQELPFFDSGKKGGEICTLAPGAVYCLSKEAFTTKEQGSIYRSRRKRQAFAVRALASRFMPEEIHFSDWRELANLLDKDPVAFLGAVSTVDEDAFLENSFLALQHAIKQKNYVPVVLWEVVQKRTVTMVPQEHWLLIKHTAPFRVILTQKMKQWHQSSIAAADGHVVSIAPGKMTGHVNLQMDSRDVDVLHSATVLFLDDGSFQKPNYKDALLLLTNNLGGMSRFHVDLTSVSSKYDCVLASNPHAQWPVDRHVFVKKIRAWLKVDGFSQPLDIKTIEHFEPGPPAKWHFRFGACDGFEGRLLMKAIMVPDRNCTVFEFEQQEMTFGEEASGAEGGDIDLIIRVDLEDRSFHHETVLTPQMEQHFNRQLSPNEDGSGFVFHGGHHTPLRVWMEEGQFNDEREWVRNIEHPVDFERGQALTGDCFSPGWFNVDLKNSNKCTLVLDAGGYTDNGKRVFTPLTRKQIEHAFTSVEHTQSKLVANAQVDDDFGEILAKSAAAYVVKRDQGKTVIAGYPWFLDWGRDTLICARGLLAAGRHDEVSDILDVFGKFVEHGTLPNFIHGDDVSNRDTSDAPLWFAVVAEDLAAVSGKNMYQSKKQESRWSLLEVLENIASGYRDGTPNGIYMDYETGLIWSPKHFTWMDTNKPAGTPREGYPVEIQVLWIRLLKQLSRLKVTHPEHKPSWKSLAKQAEKSLLSLFWDKQKGYLADCILAPSGTSAKQGTVDTALRSNCLFAVSLDVLKGVKAKQIVQAAVQHLIVPGAIRSLAPLPVDVPLPVYGAHKKLLNDPVFPYVGHYRGDEDTVRKPAYHNGTAWTWPFPVFCEALAKAYGSSATSVAAAKSYLLSMTDLLTVGCLDQIPEIIDGDAPHAQRGCDAQAWGVTEALRVWKWLNKAAD